VPKFRVHCHVEGYFEVSAQDEHDALNQGVELVQNITACAVGGNGKKVKFHDAQTEAYQVEVMEGEDE